VVLGGPGARARLSGGGPGRADSLAQRGADEMWSWKPLQASFTSDYFPSSSLEDCRTLMDCMLDVLPQDITWTFRCRVKQECLFITLLGSFSPLPGLVPPPLTACRLLASIFRYLINVEANPRSNRREFNIKLQVRPIVNACPFRLVRFN